MQEKVAFYCGIFLKAGSMIKIMTENIQHKADHVSLFQKWALKVSHEEQTTLLAHEYTVQFFY